MRPEQRDAANETLMLSIQDVAKLMRCSDRHVTNLRKKGRMPPPVKLGTLVRWPTKAIQEWIEAGCPVPNLSPQPRRNEGSCAT